MTVETKTSLTTDANNSFFDNVIGAITPAILRVFVQNVVASYLDTNTIPASSTAIAGQALMGPTTGAAAVPTFRNPTSDDVQAPSHIMLVNSTNTTGTASSTVAAFKSMAGIYPSITDPAFGADPTGVNDCTAAIQNAVNSIASGGTLVIPTGRFSVTGTVTITNPITIVGANFLNVSGANLNGAAGANTIFVINSSYVNISGLYFNRAGIATTGNAISVGTDVVQLAAATINFPGAGLGATIVAGAAAFTQADVGKQWYQGGAGPAGGLLFTTIASVQTGTTLTLVATAGTNGTFAAQYGNNYQNIVIEKSQFVNHAIGIDVQAATHLHVSQCYCEAVTGLKIQNRLWGDSGTFFVTDSIFFSTDNVNGQGMLHNSGGDLRVNSCKFLFGKYGYNMTWNFITSANLSFCNCSLEGQTTVSIFMSTPVPFVRADFTGNTSLQAFLQVDNTSSSFLSDLTVCDNSMTIATGTVGIDIGKCSQFVISGNVIDGATLGTAYAMRSNAANGRLVFGKENVSTVWTNAGSNISTTPSIATPFLGVFTQVTLTSLGVDQPLVIALPAPAPGFVGGSLPRYRIPRIIISAASGDISSATFGIFQTTGSANAIVTGSTAFTITTGTVNANNNIQNVIPANTSTQAFNITPLFFRTQATLTAGTANIYVETEFLS